ncbi:MULTISPECIES: hypothetical protein [unclassified Pseudoalteromonas]|uniref:hypothetical protein n=1 Tax=unclassified Pseudoalteromonas TaxID=194690 RepID=UPI000CA23727|nr:MULTISPECIES: hypothetical protein [unclassified Pseudoalteromonas]AUJ71571.1 hypothetical protein PNC201_16770 [Pseudoalteromonas sp. NC201]MCF7515899.1 hypothetical protein [Pseudoalteromonas sp. L7]MCF7527941.1 hypothetical protein [Pseudoalteromonas sp. L23]MCX2766184.1 hypothetical protein [Pseudoalteromonas sp. B530]
MKKLLVSPSNMALGEQESQIYQNILKQATEISLNLMAVKVENHPEDFLGWCYELLDVAKNRINFDLLDDHQLPTVKKLQDLLIAAISFLQLKTLRIAPWPMVAAFITGHKEVIVLDEQLKLIEYLKPMRSTPLKDMIKEDRLAFSGKHAANLDTSVYQFDVEWFASTKSAKGFHQLLDDLPGAFDEALATIPAEGDVTLEHYQSFMVGYLSAFAGSEEKPTLAPATRLLAMRRPDVFTPITSSKLDALCQALGVAKLNNRDFERYWTDVVSTIKAMPWYTMAAPVDEFETQLAEIKALLPCLFYYADKDTATNSNYFKLLHKPKRSGSSGGKKTVRRGKESAEVLVDRALADESIPEHIRAKRDSIVAEVEKGRSVDETISLMRTIFG